MEGNQLAETFSFFWANTTATTKAETSAARLPGSVRSKCVMTGAGVNIDLSDVVEEAVLSVQWNLISLFSKMVLQ